MPTEILRPDGDISTPWNTATPHYSLINEEVEEPELGDLYILGADDDDDNEIEEFTMDDPIATFNTCTQVDIKIRALIDSSEDMYVNIRIGSTWLTSKPAGLSGIGTWVTITWSGLSASQSDINDLRVRFISPTLAKNDNIEVNTMYAVITYATVYAGYTEKKLNRLLNGKINEAIN